MNSQRESYMGCGWSLVVAIVLIITLLLTSCKSVEYVPVPVSHTDTIYQSKVLHDSIYQHDSITIKDKGDSVWVDRWHKIYVERYRTDTIYTYVRDSIPYPIPEPYPVERKLTWWQQTRLHLANIALIALALLFVIRYIKKKI